jgi:predicted N-formylglutamate amidohydrolase
LTNAAALELKSQERSVAFRTKKRDSADGWEIFMDEASSARVPEAAVAIERADAPSPVVLVCDHASNHLPARYGLLGLTADDLAKHFAWDPGALAISRRLSALMDAPLVYGCISRLVLDVNRDLSDVDSIVETADGAIVPGNSGLSAGERERRAAEIYAPYHAAVQDLLAKRAQRGRRSALVAIHSFAPSLEGAVRPWHCGVIFASDSHLGEALVKGLQEEDGLVVGVNQPYAPSDRVYHTMSRHGEAAGNPAAMIEVRNDLVADGDGQAAWAMRLAPILQSAAQTTLDAGGAEPPKHKAIA